MAWDHPWDPTIHGSYAPGVGAGEPRASAATRRVEGAPAAAPAVAGVAHVFEESRQGSDRVGFLHGAHGDLSGPVRARGAEPRPAPAGAFQCHGTSDRGLDWTATDRGVRAGGGPTPSDP